MIRELALEGLPLDDIYIFDVHGHLGNALNMQIPSSLGVLTTYRKSYSEVLFDVGRGTPSISPMNL